MYVPNTGRSTPATLDFLKLIGLSDEVRKAILNATGTRHYQFHLHEGIGWIAPARVFPYDACRLYRDEDKVGQALMTTTENSGNGDPQSTRSYQLRHTLVEYAVIDVNGEPYPLEAPFDSGWGKMSLAKFLTRSDLPFGEVVAISEWQCVVGFNPFCTDNHKCAKEKLEAYLKHGSGRYSIRSTVEKLTPIISRLTYDEKELPEVETPEGDMWTIWDEHLIHLNAALDWTKLRRNIEEMLRKGSTAFLAKTACDTRVNVSGGVLKRLWD